MNNDLARRIGEEIESVAKDRSLQTSGSGFQFEGADAESVAMPPEVCVISVGRRMEIQFDRIYRVLPRLGSGVIPTSLLARADAKKLGELVRRCCFTHLLLSDDEGGFDILRKIINILKKAHSAENSLIVWMLTRKPRLESFVRHCDLLFDGCLSPGFTLIWVPKNKNNPTDTVYTCLMHFITNLTSDAKIAVDALDLRNLFRCKFGVASSSPDKFFVSFDEMRSSVLNNEVIELACRFGGFSEIWFSVEEATIDTIENLADTARVISKGEGLDSRICLLKHDGYQLDELIFPKPHLVMVGLENLRLNAEILPLFRK